MVIWAPVQPTKEQKTDKINILMFNIQMYEICLRFSNQRMALESLHIRSYKAEDATAILSIYKYYVLNGPYTFETSIPNEDEFSKRLDEIANRFPFYVLIKDNNLIGYAYACTHRERAAYRWAVETSIYLSFDVIGKGYGQQLYKNLLEALTERHFTHAFALIGLPNEKSLNLHKCCGFELQSIHEKAGWKNGTWIDVCWMRCRLSEPMDTPEEPVFKKSE
ncbi:MAG: N-acetyltransferase family protein [Bacteroidetes bacterium]|nr:N-acetyltransferase family protein [Bacteroidota bacterium]